MPKIMFRPNPTPPPFVPPVPPTPIYPFPVAGSAKLTPASWLEGDFVQCEISWDSTSDAESWLLYGFKDGNWEETLFNSDGTTQRTFYFEDAPFASNEYEKYCVVGTSISPTVPSENLCFPVSD